MIRYSLLAAVLFAAPFVVERPAITRETMRVKISRMGLSGVGAPRFSFVSASMFRNSIVPVTYDGAARWIGTANRIPTHARKDRKFAVIE